MDYVSNEVALKTIARAIESDIIPAVSDGHARGQLWACAGLLSNIANELKGGREEDRHGSVGADLDAFLRDRGMEAALPRDGEVSEGALVPVVEELESDLDEVIAGHSSLHFRRAIDGFSS